MTIIREFDGVEEAMQRMADAANQAMATDELVWRTHPAATQPGKAVAVLAYVAAAGVAVQVCFGTLWMTAIGLLVLVVAAQEFLFVTTCRVNDTGVERRGLFGVQRLTWSQVRAVHRGPDGVKLSTLARAGWLEPYRGVYLPCGDRCDEVLGWVTRHVAGAADPEEVPGASGRAA